MSSTRQDIDVLVTRLAASMAAMTRRAAVRRLYEQVARVAGAEIERPSYLVLQHLVADGPARITDMAHHHGVEPSTLSRNVSALVEAGLATKSPDPDDRRAAVTEASAEGVSLVERVEAERHRIFAELLSEWAADDAGHLVALIERFNDDITSYLDRP